MRVAIFTLTRDRFLYTKRCFNLLWQNAGYPYAHYVIDNGSTDGTAEWLVANRQRFTLVGLEPENIGISRASNTALNLIGNHYDLICKMDNDCEMITANLVAEMVRVFKDAPRPMMLSPRVEGINRQPKRAYTITVGDYEVGRTGIVGGLCHWLPADVYQRYRSPEDLPKAWGQDDHLCDWVYKQGIEMGYVEALTVNHYEGTTGQAQRYPDYFARKFAEEKA